MEEGNAEFPTKFWRDNYHKLYNFHQIRGCSSELNHLDHEQCLTKVLPPPLCFFPFVKKVLYISLH